MTASWDNTAKIWQRSTGLALHKLVGHEGNVNSAVFSPDGTRLVFQSNRDGKFGVYVLDLETDEVTPLVAPPGGEYWADWR